MMTGLRGVSISDRLQARALNAPPLPLLVVLLAVMFGAAAALVGGWAVSGLVLAALAWLGYAHFPLFLWGFLVVRTSLDLPFFAGAFSGAGANAAQATTLALLAFGLIYLVGAPSRAALDGVGKAFALFLALLALTFATSADRAATLQDWAKLASFLLVYLVVRREAARSGRAYGRWSYAVLLAAVAPAVAGYLQLVGADIPAILTGLAPSVQAQFGDVGRVSGTLPAINAFAMFLMMPMALAGALAMGARRGSAVLWVALGLLVALLPLFINTFTRAAWYGFGVAVLAFGGLRVRRLLLLAPLGVVLLGATDPLLVQRFLDVDASSTSAGTLAHRLAIWQQALEISASHPILGVGLGVGTWQAGEAAFNYRISVHNDYLRVLVDAGLVGLSAYLAHLAVTTAALWRATRITRSTVPAAALAVWLGLLVTRATDNVLTNPAVQLYLWTVVAIALGHADWAARNAVRKAEAAPQASGAA